MQNALRDNHLNVLDSRSSRINNALDAQNERIIVRTLHYSMDKYALRGYIRSGLKLRLRWTGPDHVD